MTKSSASSPVVDQVNASPSGSVAVYGATVGVFSGTDCDASPVITGGSFTLVTVTVTASGGDDNSPSEATTSTS